MFLQISSISNFSRIKMRFKKLRFSKSSFLKRVLLMTSQSHDHVVKIIFCDMNLKAPTIIYKTCARNKLYLLYFSHSYTTKRRRKTQKMSSIVYQWAGKPTGENQPRPVLPRPEMHPPDLEQVN